jgi:oxalate decarboxylase/phosphoglucose isomerase-like protein (cupin superfamily)
VRRKAAPATVTAELISGYSWWRVPEATALCAAPGALSLIEHGDPHEIRNSGRAPLRTLNLYSPPAYRADGRELPAGRG